MLRNSLTICFLFNELWRSVIRPFKDDILQGERLLSLDHASCSDKVGTKCITLHMRCILFIYFCCFPFGFTWNAGSVQGSHFSHLGNNSIYFHIVRFNFFIQLQVRSPVGYSGPGYLTVTVSALKNIYYVSKRLLGICNR